jgi:hypothetical protein
MKKFLIPRANLATPANMRGKVAELVFDRECFDRGEGELADKQILYQYDRLIKLNRMDRSLMFNHPTFYKRLSEEKKPCDIRRQKVEDERRAVDRSITNSFCDWFMWANVAHKPKPNRKTKK